MDRIIDSNIDFFDMTCIKFTITICQIVIVNLMQVFTIFYDEGPARHMINYRP